MYASIVSNPASAPAASDEVYYHLPHSHRHRSCTVNYQSTWSWNTPQEKSHAGGNHPHIFTEDQN